MPADQGEGPKPGSGELTFRQAPKPNEQRGFSPETSANALAPQRIYEKLTRIPKGEDPAFWPVRVLNDLVYLSAPQEFPDRQFPKQWAPFRESLLRVRMAYQVLAYPHTRSELSREFIEEDLTMDQEFNKRDQIALNDSELVILRKLAVTAKIPVDPLQHTYDYSEVFHPPHPIPKALGSPEFLLWLAEQEKAS